MTLAVELTIINALGLHARCAAQLARVADLAIGDVWLSKDGEQADAKSVMDILSLAATQGSQISLQITHPEDRHLLTAITELINSGFGEATHA